MSRWNGYRGEMLAFMEPYDVLLCPVSSTPATRHDDPDGPDFTYTFAHNLTGWPGAVVRCGTSPEGLPIGVQIVARPWREDVGPSRRPLSGDESWRLAKPVCVALGLPFRLAKSLNAPCSLTSNTSRPAASWAWILATTSGGIWSRRSSGNFSSSRVGRKKKRSGEDTWAWVLTEESRYHCPRIKSGLKKRATSWGFQAVTR